MVDFLYYINQVEYRMSNLLSRVWYPTY